MYVPECVCVKVHFVYHHEPECLETPLGALNAKINLFFTFLGHVWVTVTLFVHLRFEACSFRDNTEETDTSVARNMDRNDSIVSRDKKWWINPLFQCTLQWGWQILLKGFLELAIGLYSVVLSAVWACWLCRQKFLSGHIIFDLTALFSFFTIVKNIGIEITLGLILPKTCNVWNLIVKYQPHPWIWSSAFLVSLERCRQDVIFPITNLLLLQFSIRLAPREVTLWRANFCYATSYKVS